MVYLLRRHQLAFESIEPRHCLSNVVFAQNDIACCSTTEADFVMTADLDGDGDPDVLSASKVDNKIAWYQNTDSAGTFGPQRIIDATQFALGAVQLTTGDLDGDGDLDVIASTFFFNQEIVWYENVDGDGGFSSKKLIAVEPGLKSIAIADLDGNGTLDVVATSSVDGGRVFWHQNIDGRGEFSALQLIDSGVGETAIKIADLDGDGDADIVTTGSFAGTSWYVNTDGKALFGSSTSISEIGASSLSIGDLNADGSLDLIGTINDVGGNRVAWIENSRGNFGTYQTISTNVDSPVSVAAADLDGDGDVDVASASSLDNKIAWYANVDGFGNFGTQIAVANDAQLAASVAVADLDGDGDQDLLSASTGDSKVAWYENTDSLGQFGTPKLLSSNAKSIDSVMAADLDGDGDEDALLTYLDGSTSQVLWRENVDGAGDFGKNRIILDGVTRASASAADLDGDADLDVLVHSLATGILTWYANSGTGTFSQETVISGSAARWYNATDIDGDNDLDLLITSGTGIGWHENIDGQGNFGTVRTISTGNFGSPIAADIDGDLNLDVVVSSPMEKAVWFSNIGQGIFGAERVIGNDDSVADLVETGDLDGDGDPDVILSRHDDKITWYENKDGLGAFEFRQTIDGGHGSDIVRAIDLDGDTDVDIVSRGILDGRIVWHANIDGEGTFGTPFTISHDTSVLSLDVGDLDRDGDVDVLYNSAERLAWMEQRLVADVNDDGVFDSSDLVRIFQIGEFEDQIANNSTFDDGDWNGDGEFNTTDLVLAFQCGNFVRTASPKVSAVGGALEDVFFEAESDEIKRRKIFGEKTADSNND